MGARKNNNKYNSITLTAKALFWKYGLKKVSIEEICCEAKVSKMTFYKHFSNKEDLAKKILDTVTEEAVNKFERLTKSNVPFTEKLEKLFLLKLEGMNNISLDFINDIYNNPNSTIAKHMIELQQNFMGSIINFYTNAQKDGYIRKDVNINFILASTAQITHLMKDEALMAQYKQPQDFIIEYMNQLFYGIVDKNVKQTQ